MNLRAKTLLSLTTLAAVSVLGLFITSRQVLRKSLLELERNDHRRSYNRVLDALTEAERRMTLKIADLSTWDDTYEYIAKPTKRFEESNLDPSLFASQDIDMMLFTDNEGRTIHFDGRVDGTGDPIREIPPAITELVQKHRELFQWKDGNDFRVGVLVSGDAVLQVAFRGITNSAMDRPIRGTIMQIRTLNPRRNDHVGQLTDYTVSLAPAPPMAIGSDPAEIRITPQTEDTIVGQGYLRDLYGQPSVELRVQASRMIYQQGKKNLFYSLMMGTALCLGLVLAVILLIHFLMISRLFKINAVISLNPEKLGEEEMESLSRFGRDEIGQLAHRIQSLYFEVRKLADYDELTGVHNVRHFKYLAEKRYQTSRRHSRRFAIVLFDVDHFKKVNDQYGHLQGDAVLKAVGNFLLGQVRGGDICARYGGEEFILLLSETEREGALAAAERIREQLNATEIPMIDNPEKKMRITASFGVTIFRAPEETLEKLLTTADQALYQAKSQGRNQSVFREASL